MTQKKEETFNTYAVSELLTLWEQLKGDGIPSNVPLDKIEAMHRYIKETAPRDSVHGNPRIKDNIRGK